MQRNLGKSLKNNLKFISIDGSLFIDPYTLAVKKTIIYLLKKREESSDTAAQLAFTCSKLTIDTIEQGVK